MDPYEALTQSIGEYALMTLGAETLQKLQVKLDPRDLTAEILLVLKDDSDEGQRTALVALFDIEATFISDAVLSYRFVSDFAVDAAAADHPKYSYA